MASSSHSIGQSALAYKVYVVLWSSFLQNRIYSYDLAERYPGGVVSGEEIRISRNGKDFPGFSGPPSSMHDDFR
jgi:hypothetical protein